MNEQPINEKARTGLSDWFYETHGAFLVQGAGDGFMEARRRQQEQAADPEPREPEYIYVSGRTFWDWLAEQEPPKRKTLWKIAGVSLLAILGFGMIFFCSWIQYFGADWARVPVFITTIVVVIACCLGVIFTICPDEAQA